MLAKQFFFLEDSMKKKQSKIERTQYMYIITEMSLYVFFNNNNKKKNTRVSYKLKYSNVF